MTTLTCDCEAGETCSSCVRETEDKMSELAESLLPHERYLGLLDRQQGHRPPPKLAIAIDLNHLRQRMALFVAEVSPHDPTAYTIPFEVYLQWEMNQQKEKTNGE
jgi:hypothetical protein